MAFTDKMFQLDLVSNLAWLEQIRSSPYGELQLMASAACGLLFAYLLIDTLKSAKVVWTTGPFPLVGSPVWSLPMFVHNLVYLARAAKSAQEGYRKFQSRAFQLLQNQGSVVVLPHNLLEELASIPDGVASARPALSSDLAGRFTGLDMIVKNRLQNVIIQRRLTPRLPLLVPRLQNSAAAAFDEYFPESRDWVEFQPYHVLKHISARLAADVIVGPGLCDDPAWLDVSVKYTENVFATSMILRMFPSWTHRLICPFLPSYWTTRRCFATARETLGPKIEELTRLHDQGRWEPSEDDGDDLNVLRWLCGLAKGPDRNPDTIAHVCVLLTLASVHNNLFRTLNVLYDVTAAGPDLSRDLGDEISSRIMTMMGESKGGGGNAATSSYDYYDRLHLLDSVLCESQRVSPPQALGMKRLFKVPYTFQDGTHIPAGTYTCMAASAIENDPANVPFPFPEKFDGYRRLRAAAAAAATAAGEEEEEEGETAATNTKEFLFTTPSRTSLAWGYGKSACPGRYFASYVIKMMLVRMFSGDYEFEFLPGQGRPGNVFVYDFSFINPWQKMLVRRIKPDNDKVLRS